MTATSLQTPLYRWHVEHRARMVDFAGWSMPIQYTSIVEEHQATRRQLGLFDISHMGRLQFSGSGAAQLLDRLVTRRVADMSPGRIRYALVTNEQGGILDDVLVYCLAGAEGGSLHQMVVNASNREKIVDWIRSHIRPDDQVQLVDQTLETAMIAVQGPHALETVAPLVTTDVARMKYYTGAMSMIGGHPGIVSRTGYTGEDGCELIVGKDDAVAVWEAVCDRGQQFGVKPIGLGARDTLRLEAAMPLYGHELSESVDPFQAGLDFAVNLQQREFIGCDALKTIEASGLKAVRIGLELTGKRVARQHAAVYRGAELVGEITSGTFSPTLEKPIAMAYVRPSAATVGIDLQIDIRGRKEPAIVVKLPFYQRPKGT